MRGKKYIKKLATSMRISVNQWVLFGFASFIYVFAHKRSNKPHLMAIFLRENQVTERVPLEYSINTQVHSDVFSQVFQAIPGIFETLN